MTTDLNRMLSTEDAAAFLALKPCTLAAWREDGSQPDLPFFKIGKAVRYRYGDVLDFLAARRAVSTLAARRINPAVSLAKPDDAKPMPEPTEQGGPKRKKSAPAEGSVEGQQSLF